MATSIRRKYFLLELRHRIKEVILNLIIPLKSSCIHKPRNLTKSFVAIIDGSATHGGMCDRFKGIITLYAYCKHNNLPFRIKYTYPFRLEEYLSPAVYDWTLKDDYTDNPLYCRILYMRKEYLARRLLKLHTERQVHFYGNRDSLEYINKAYADSGVQYKWGNLFRELFKPTPILEEKINQVKKVLGSNYYAAVFRFQNLLGDFKEYDFQAINDQAKADELIAKCLESLKTLLASNNMPLLVTSDSQKFLNAASRINGVYIIPGTLVHMDNLKGKVSDSNREAFLKSFVDFYMLSEAQKIYRIGTQYMYPSEFPLYAAKINGTPFESITI